jgi:rhodanese-related sulfurtransferase
MKKSLSKFLPLMMVTIFLTTCGTEEKKDDQQQASVEKTMVLLDWLEAGGNYINSAEIPSIIDPEVVYDMRNENILIIDLRSDEDYRNGHIEHAVHLDQSQVLDFFKNKIDPAAFTSIFFVCNNGNLSGYVTGIMRLLGYNNTFAIRFGLCAWDKEIAEEYWLANTSSHLVGKLNHQGNPKAKAGDYPAINVEGNTGFEIAWERAAALLNEKVSDFTITLDQLEGNYDSFYTMCYWPEDKYLNNGHLPGAVQYTPKKSLSRGTYLNTVPVDKPNVVYCYSGQHSKFVTAYLRMLGYDSRSLAYGANGFIHEVMAETEPRPTRTYTEKLIQDLPLIRGGVKDTLNTNKEMTTETVAVDGGC